MSEWQIVLMIVGIVVGVVQFFTGIILKGILATQNRIMTEQSKLRDELQLFRLEVAKTQIDPTRYEDYHKRLGKVEEDMTRIKTLMIAADLDKGQLSF